MSTPVKDKAVTVEDLSEALKRVNIPLPAVTSSDNGKILTVANGEWDKGNIPTELPTVTSSDEGKVLRVSAQGTWVAQTPTTELPSVTSSDEGKFLTVNSSGQWVATSMQTWQGGSY